MTRLLSLLIFTLLFCGHQRLEAQAKLDLLPYPNAVAVGSGTFKLNDNTLVFTSNKAKSISEILVETKGLKTTQDSIANNIICFEDKANLGRESYELIVEQNKIRILASNPTGHFYGLQTLLQLIFNSNEIPVCEIKDQPKFAYRGIMLDVARHFMPKSAVKKLIDVMAVYKLNTLHWHLTDDQGWRIEIKKYPKLTSVGSLRKESMEGHYREMKFDGKPYGGFYTQLDIKEIVAYAQSKYITIIPEIEMPGHAVAALSAYPQYGCSGGPYEVRTTWGVATDVYCPYEETFTFLEDILSETMTLFPSKYIHIGGDECPKDSWKASEFCQNLIKEKQLGDEHGLQSYFIKRIDKFITSKGKKLIGWDEILEGGLSPNATVMSWRGEVGGITAAKEGHDVIMSPNSYLYFDYYQGSPKTEPLAIGGFLPLQKVYSYEPLSAELSKEEQKHILGVQANLWTEYIKTPEKMQYMLFPRALALAEIAWTSKKDSYSGFVERVEQQFKRLDQVGIDYAMSMYSIDMSLLESNAGEVKFELSTAIPKANIRYTIDGSDPSVKSAIFPSQGVSLTKDAEVKANLFIEGKKVGNTFSQNILVNKLTNMTYARNYKESKYLGNSKNGLSDGIIGTIDKLDNWVGLNGDRFEVVYDFPQKQKVNSLRTTFLHAPSSWIMLPKNIQVYGSKDGKIFKLLSQKIIAPELNPEDRTESVFLQFKPKKLKSLKVVAESFGPLPESHPGKGNPSWLFIDEIEVK